MPPADGEGVLDQVRETEREDGEHEDKDGEEKDTKKLKSADAPRAKKPQAPHHSWVRPELSHVQIEDLRKNDHGGQILSVSDFLGIGPDVMDTVAWAMGCQGGAETMTIWEFSRTREDEFDSLLTGL